MFLSEKVSFKNCIKITASHKLHYLHYLQKVHIRIHRTHQTTIEQMTKFVNTKSWGTTTKDSGEILN